MNSKDIDFQNIPIYIIHISGNHERHDLITNQFEKLGSKNINIVEAVTPDNVNQFSVLNKCSDFSVFSNEKDKRYVCCTLSHRLMHEIAKENEDEYFIILEDDFKILDSFSEWKLKVIQKEFEFDIMPIGGYYGLYDDSNWFEKTNDDELYVVKQITCSVATLYSRKGSETFMDAFDKSFNLSDCVGADAFHHGFVFSSAVTKSLFPLAITTHASMSDITKTYTDHETYFNNYFNHK